jgi:hypothetical protein
MIIRVHGEATADDRTQKGSFGEADSIEPFAQRVRKLSR